MKKIIITGSHLKREFFIWLLSFIAAIILNIYAIVNYETSWVELYSQIGYVVMISIMLYIASWGIRGFFLLVKNLISKRDEK
ncbi:MAG: hypothetical protein PF486_01330 [Prolixibacteraceae bacterium]|jgi:hypothetical protein|nr:hypothetical protein [Prolixibacteraceae bacterium]